jgi:alpha-glucosidase
MRDVDIAPEESVDPPALRFSPESRPWDRSGCRTPMPWAPGQGSDFTSGRPWLRLGPDVEERNVEAQLADGHSVLWTYRRLLALRAASPALQLGSLRLHPDSSGEIVAYTREVPGERILVLLNLGRGDSDWHPSATAGESGWRLLFGTARAAAPGSVVASGASLILGPDEAVVLEAIS